MAASEWLKEMRQAAGQRAANSPQMASMPAGCTQTPTEALAGGNSINTTANAQSAQKRHLKPFTTIDGKDYRAAYRAACDFHERHNPPTIGSDGGALYWQEVTDDMQTIAQQFNGDPFITGLLCAVFEELERQFMALME